MRIHWYSLLSGVFVLWFPTLLLRLGKGQRIEEARLGTVSLPQMLRSWGNWVNLLRAMLGAWLLLTVSFEAAEDDRFAAKIILLTQGALLLIGVLLQMACFARIKAFFAPVFYLTGITIVLPGWECGAFAAAVAWGFALALRDVRHLLLIMAIALGVGGWFLSASKLLWVLNLCLIFTPLLLSVLLLRDLRFLSAQSAER
jgi:hypothetical protein